MKLFCLYFLLVVPALLCGGESFSSSDFKEKLPIGTSSLEVFELVLIKGTAPPPPKKDPKRFKVVPMPKMKTLMTSRFRTLEGSCKIVYTF